MAQDISIFFLKDGSIVQGQVVNENQYRIFLKTEQGLSVEIMSQIKKAIDPKNIMNPGKIFDIN